MTRIEWDDLTPAFQDAISITRSLWVEYIWLDSLCIIQDCLSDWMHKAGNVSNVYKMTYRIIAASSSTEVDTRCFWGRDSYYLTPLEVECPWYEAMTDDFTPLEFDPESGPSVEIGSIKLRKSLCYLQYRQEDVLSDLEHEPLGSCGWVFQERILSRCVLHFTKSQLYFECAAKLCCEAFPNGIAADESSGRSMSGRKEFRDLRFDFYEGREAKKMRLYNIWAGLLRVFCKTELTHEKDRLSAIAGIAKEMSHLLDDSYHAGLWESELLYHLFWRVDILPSLISHPDPSSPCIYLAPSWSWASTNYTRIKPYQFYRCCWGSERLVQILEVETKGRTHLRSATLVISSFGAPCIQCG